MKKLQWRYDRENKQYVDDSTGSIYIIRGGRPIKINSKTFYRGLSQPYRKDYDKSKLDNVNGYESWTDSIDLAKEYAGKNGYVYSIDVKENKVKDDIYDAQGNRNLIYDNNKPVDLHNVHGNEYMLYTYHDDWDALKYKEESGSKYDTSKFTNKELDAITNYNGAISYVLNDSLRKNIDLSDEVYQGRNLKEYSDNLSSALSKLDTYTGEVNRSVNFTKDDLDKFKINSEVVMEGFTSSSKNQIYDDTMNTQIEIISKTGKDLKNFSRDNENEVLFDKNSKFKVLNNYEENGKTKLVLEEVDKTEYNDKYNNAKLTEIGNKTIVQLSNGEIVSELSKKEYNELSKKFADSLNEQETKTIQAYVDSPGYSGELNAQDDAATKYSFFDTDKNLTISKNDLNKYYTEVLEQYKKDGFDTNYTNPSWPTDEQRAWAKDMLGDKDSYSNEENLIRQMLSREKGHYSYDATNKYYTDDELKEIKEIADKIRPLEEQLSKYNYNDDEYMRLRDEIVKIGNNKSLWYYDKILNVNNEMVFNSKDYNFDELEKNGEIKWLGAKQINDLKSYNPNQTTAFINSKEQIDNYLKEYDRLFEEKGITLEHDTLVFRRGRETREQIEDSFTKYGITSTTAFDTLPKKMPSGLSFGDKRYYILLPSGTKVLLSEQVIGRGYEDKPEYEQIWKGVRRQHEILLKPNTSFIQLDKGYTNDGKDYNYLLMIKED